MNVKRLHFEITEDEVCELPPDGQRLDDVGIGYTLATGKLFCDLPEFQKWAEALLERPILTHEFAGEAMWDELRVAFETAVVEAHNTGGGPDNGA